MRGATGVTVLGSIEAKLDPPGLMGGPQAMRDRESVCCWNIENTEGVWDVKSWHLIWSLGTPMSDS